MELQSSYSLHPNRYPSISIVSKSFQISQFSCLVTIPYKTSLQSRKIPSQNPNSNTFPRFIINALSDNNQSKIPLPPTPNVGSGRFDRAEPFGGKSGSMSFYGVSHQVIEEGKLVNAPFKDGKSSLLWILAPVAFISSLILPQFFLGGVIDSFIRDDILAEIVASFSSEALFYLGLSTFLLITDRVQRPYLEFSPKRWGLITGLNGYLSSAFFTMGFKVVAPVFAVYVTWDALGLASAVAVAPFLIGCAAQYIFEIKADKRGSSSWPLIPLIFEVYRLYQLSKAANFVERLMMAMRGSAVSNRLMERRGALVGLLVTFQVLGVLCLWSLMTFLIRLFPSRPVVENY
ncbi:hypothetical protein ACHQM5_023334 [Ranunculus cassubicifolius]